MTRKIKYGREGQSEGIKVGLPQWPRVILLIILGYEAAGCLVGGSFLIAAPDGNLMDMPVDIMRGAFPDFLIPGILLFGLGILNATAFIAVLRRTAFDWLLALLSLGGLLIWFVVEIIILQELHWLHAMWGLPVVLGLVMTIPLIAVRHDTFVIQRALLACGIFSSLWYFAINIFTPLRYEGYSMASMAVSELSAIGAPTRILWVLLVPLYTLLFAAFGWGILKMANGNRTLRFVGGLIIVYSIINLYWPPMHQREILAAGGATLTDTLHIVWTIITLLLMMILMGFGAAASGKRFRFYTILTFGVFIVFGILTFREASGMEANLPTPWMGLWERVNIAAFMLWVIIFAIGLLRKIKPVDELEL